MLLKTWRMWGGCEEGDIMSGNHNVRRLSNESCGEDMIIIIIMIIDCTDWLARP
jgi:hypothetical protein